MDNNEDFQTPVWVCKMMANLLQSAPYKVRSVLEPTPGKGNLVRALEDQGYAVTAPRDFWQVRGGWDAACMNPPFSPMSEGYRILFAVMDMTEVIVALMPWLTLINSKRRAGKIDKFGLRAVYHLPRDVFPGSRVQTCILHMQRGWHPQASFDFLEEGDG